MIHHVLARIVAPLAAIALFATGAAAAQSQDTPLHHASPAHHGAPGEASPHDAPMHDAPMHDAPHLAAARHAPKPGTPERAAAPAADGGLAAILDGAAFEIAFMQQMIEHHIGAIAMVDALLASQPDTALREDAEAIRAAQDPEIAQMTRWLETWYGAAPADDTGAGMDGHAMPAGDADPDAAFLSAMIEHHDGAIDMAQLALVRAVHPELRALARDIILVQADEIFRYAQRLAAR